MYMENINIIESTFIICSYKVYLLSLTVTHLRITRSTKYLPGYILNIDKSFNN